MYHQLAFPATGQGQIIVAPRALNRFYERALRTTCIGTYTRHGAGFHERAFGQTMRTTPQQPSPWHMTPCRLVHCEAKSQQVEAQGSSKRAKYDYEDEDEELFYEAEEMPEDGEYEDDELEEAEELTYEEELNMQYGQPGVIEFSQGENGMTRAWISHPYSSMGAEIYLHGATITQWRRPDGCDALLVGPHAKFDYESPIDAGIQTIFPQYREGTIIENGFANRLPWEVVATGFDMMADWDGLGPEEELEEAARTLLEFEFDQKAAAEGEEDEEGAAASKEDAKQQQEAATASSSDASAQQQQQEEEEEGEMDQEERVYEDAKTWLAAASSEYSETLLERVYEGYDPAPFITLRLTDNKFTRSMWPHRFELLLKVTVSETDDYPSVNLETQDKTYSLTESLTEMIREDEAAEEEEMESLVADEPYNELQEKVDESGRPEVPVQLKLKYVLRNLDTDPRAPPMFVHLGMLATFLTRDQASFGDFVKVLGLGNLNTFDYTEDDRFPRLGSVDDDYVHFDGRIMDMVCVDGAKADVLFCPGERTHYQLIQRSGFKDVTVQHPGFTFEDDSSRFQATLGAGRFSIPKKLAPGQEWEAELVIRHHDFYWQTPTFGEGSVLSPIGLTPPEEGESEGDDDSFDQADSNDASLDSDDAEKLE